jgi:hypothetical protein
VVREFQLHPYFAWVRRFDVGCVATWESARVLASCPV